MPVVRLSPVRIRPFTRMETMFARRPIESRFFTITAVKISDSVGTRPRKQGRQTYLEYAR